MKAAIFYQEPSTKARVLKLVSEADWQDNQLAHASAFAESPRPFTGQLGEVCVVQHTIWVGMGANRRRDAIAAVATSLPAGAYVFADKLNEEEALVWSLAQYRFDRYKGLESPVRCLEIENKEKILRAAEAIFWVRDLINTPCEDMGPTELADEALKLAKTYGAECQICIGEDLLRENYPAIYTVGRAAADSPRLIHLSWGESHQPLIALVGKGVCFDSGGLDLKSADGMRLMKKDMGGAAHALGLAQWIMASQLPIRLEVYIPAVENAVGPGSYRPGDVIRMRNGLTVEIENTDAEGRLILADALAKASEASPTLMIDFATLTGAARVAVGTEIAAYFSNQEGLADTLHQSSRAVNDPIWRLPLFSAYESLLKSNVADLANASTSSYAGAITAALFLQKFVDPNIPWVHFDMMAWNLSSKPGQPEGGEAMGLRMLMNYLAQGYQVN